MYTLKDVSSHDFVVEYAQHLKKTGKMEVPKWVDLCKTGPFKELAPYDEDFYFIRAGIYRRPPPSPLPLRPPLRPTARGGAGVQPPPRVSGLRPRWPAPGLSTLLSGFQQPAASLPSDPPQPTCFPLAAAPEVATLASWALPLPLFSRACLGAASIARKIYLRQGTGVGAFRKIYGGNKNRGTRTEHFQKASGGLIRSILHNLESMGVVEKMEDGCERPPPPPLHPPSSRGAAPLGHQRHLLYSRSPLTHSAQMAF
eukprot:COSAG01_NODE_144_length_24108_cov_11.490441_13_plen_256_part_00